MSRPALLLGLLLAGVVGYLLLRPDPTEPLGAPEARGPHDAASSPSLHGKRIPHVPLSRIEVEADKREAEGRAVPQLSVEQSSMPPTGAVEVRGRLVEFDGRPAFGSVIQWQPVGSDGKLVTSGPSTFVRDDGTFLLLVVPAEVVHLEGRGSSALKTSFAVPFPADRDFGTLRMDHGTSLEGRILLGGRPLEAGRVDIQARRCLAGEDCTPAAQGTAATSEWELSRDQRVEIVHASVDAQGRWRLDGLRPGVYVVEVESVASGWLHQAVRAAHRQVVTAPALDVDFELALSMTHIVPDHPRWYDNSFKDLMVSFTDAAGRTSEVEAWFNQEWSGEGDYSMALTPGATYQVRVWSNGYLPLVFDHVAPPAGEETSIPVRLDPAPRGRLRIEPPPGCESPDLDVYVELFDRKSGERVHWDAVDLGEKGASEPLLIAQGSWTLVITPWGVAAGRRSNMDLPESRSIDVAAGTEQRIRWIPPQGGRFNLRVDAPDGAARALVCRVERRGTTPRATLVRSAAAGSDVLWSDMLETGWAYVGVDAFPPGELTLLVSATDTKPLRVPVHIVAGQVTPVRITLEPR